MGVYVNHSLTIVSKDASTNTARARYTVTCTTSGESYNLNTQTGEFKVDGVTFYSDYTLPKYTTTTVFDWTVTVNNASGKTVYASYDFHTTPYHGYQVGSTSVYIDLPLYPTVTHSLKEKSINSISVNWSSDSTINYVWYSLDNGTTWEAVGEVNDSSGEYTISNLTPNQTYNILTRLRRASNNLTKDSTTLTVQTYNIATFTNTPNVNIGSPHTLTWTNPSGAITSIKLYETDGTTLIQDFGTKDGTSATLTPTANNIYSLIPNANSIVLRYYIFTTANGQTYSSYSECTFSVVNSNPIFSDFTYADNNTTITALTGNSGNFVKGYSTITATISVANKAAAQNGASMNRYTLGNDSAAYSDNSAVNVVSTTPITSDTIMVYAIDSRENSTGVTKTINSNNYLEYEGIVITGVSAVRGSGGVGKEVTLTYSGKIWNNNFGVTNNSIKTITYSYRINGTQQWTVGSTQLLPVLSGNTFSQTVVINGDLQAEGFDTANSYDIKIDVADELSNSNYQTIFGPGKPLLAYSLNGIAIGGPYDETLGGALQVYGDINYNNQEIPAIDTLAPKASPTFTGTPKAPTAARGTNTTQIATTAFVQDLKTQLLDLMHPVGEVFTTTDSTFNPNTSWGGTWTQLTDDAYFKIVTSGAGSLGGTSSEHKIPASSMPTHGGHINDTTTTWWDDAGENTYTFLTGSGYQYGTHAPYVERSGELALRSSSRGASNAYYPYYYGVYAWHRTA